MALGEERFELGRQNGISYPLVNTSALTLDSLASSPVIPFPLPVWALKHSTRRWRYVTWSLEAFVVDWSAAGGTR